MASASFVPSREKRYFNSEQTATSIAFGQNWLSSSSSDMRPLEIIIVNNFKDGMHGPGGEEEELNVPEEPSEEEDSRTKTPLTFFTTASCR